MSVSLPVLGFERTTCACRTCVAACRVMPGMLIPADLPKLAGSDDPALIAEWAHRHLWASPGATAIIDGKLERIPTLVPRSVTGGACQWLDKGRCTVHARAPFGCSHFDTHMDAEEGQRRSVAAITAIRDSWRAYRGEIEGDGHYAAVWMLLKASGLIRAKDTNVLRSNLQSLIEREARPRHFKSRKRKSR